MSTTPPEDCERREDKTGMMAWLNRNLTIPAILAVLGLLGGAFVALSGFTSKVESGAQAHLAVKAIEKDYASKKELETAIGATHARIGRMENKIDTLTIEILKRLPEK